MTKVRVIHANVRNVVRKLRHEIVVVALVFIFLFDHLTEMRRNLNQTDGFVALQLALVLHDVSGNLMDVIRIHTIVAPIARPKTNLIEWNAHSSMFPCKIRSV